MQRKPRSNKYTLNGKITIFRQSCHKKRYCAYCLHWSYFCSILLVCSHEEMYLQYQQQRRQTQSIYCVGFSVISFKLYLTFLYLPDLLISRPFVTCLCIFQLLVYGRSTGQRYVFAHSLTRKGWHHIEQICSCKVNPTEENHGLFVGVWEVRWGSGGCAVTTRPSDFTTVINIFFHLHTQSSSRNFLSAFTVVFFLLFWSS